MYKLMKSCLVYEENTVQNNTLQLLNEILALKSSEHAEWNRILSYSINNRPI